MKWGARVCVYRIAKPVLDVNKHSKLVLDQIIQDNIHLHRNNYIYIEHCIPTEYYLTHLALWLKEMGALPGGAPSTFCEPLYTTSTSHWSMRNGAPPNEATVSTNSRQSCLQTEM